MKRIEALLKSGVLRWTTPPKARVHLYILSFITERMNKGSIYFLVMCRKQILLITQ